MRSGKYASIKPEYFSFAYSLQTFAGFTLLQSCLTKKRLIIQILKINVNKKEKKAYETYRLK
jgi:hypothetical protein